MAWTEKQQQKPSEERAFKTALKSFIEDEVSETLALQVLGEEGIKFTKELGDSIDNQRLIYKVAFDFNAHYSSIAQGYRHEVVESEKYQSLRSEKGSLAAETVLYLRDSVNEKLQQRYPNLNAQAANEIEKMYYSLKHMNDSKPITSEDKARLFAYEDLFNNYNELYEFEDDYLAVKKVTTDLDYIPSKFLDMNRQLMKEHQPAVLAVKELFKNLIEKHENAIKAWPEKEQSKERF